MTATPNPASIDKHAALSAKVAAMADEQKKARVEQLYAKPALTDEESLEFFAIMFGGTR